MAKRTRALARRVRTRARKDHKPAPRKRGPKPGTRSWRKFNYTPELIADARYRYEETEETVVSIALGYGVDESTIRRLAKSEGWVRRPRQRMSCATPQADDYDDDIPTDLDAFRDELARRIRAFVESRAGEGRC